MQHSDEQAGRLTPDQRLQAVAAILAGAIVRLHQRAALTPAESGHGAQEIPPESIANNLDVPVESRLSVQRG